MQVHGVVACRSSSLRAYKSCGFAHSVQTPLDQLLPSPTVGVPRLLPSPTEGVLLPPPNFPLDIFVTQRLRPTRSHGRGAGYGGAVR
jgi:hypothetical protein